MVFGYPIGCNTKKIKMKNLLPKAIPGLQTLLDNKVTHHRFDLDCATMPAFEKYDRGNSYKGNLTDIFKKLASIKTSIIYWFQFNDPLQVRQQLRQLERYRRQQKRVGKKDRRIVPLTNATSTGGILYVGKRLGGCHKKTGFTYAGDRIEMHLGYNPNGGNQGLQLCHWCDSKLTLKVVELPKSAAPYLTAIELLFALELNPRLGRH